MIKNQTHHTADNNINNRLKKRLSSRHLSMIAMGGSIGTGLFIASGGTIHLAGPSGAMLAYILVGFLIYFMMSSLGEMSSYMPSAGSFCCHSRAFVGKSFGKAMSVNYYFNWAITLAVELSAGAMIMQYWFPHCSSLIWISTFFVSILIINLLNVRFYAELESYLSLIKIIAIIGFLVIGGLLLTGVIGSNHTNINTPTSILHNWMIGNHGFHGGLTAMFIAFVLASFSFQGVELVGVAAGEAENPGISIPRAIRQVFWRIIIFYILTIAIIASLIHYNDPRLLASDNNQIAHSPFTMILAQSGMPHVASFMNFIILIAVLSAANSNLYSSSRILFAMSESKNAPRIFGVLTKNGVPIFSVLLTALIASVVFLSSMIGNGALFMWLLNISTLSGVVAWLGIIISHIGFRRHLRREYISLSSLNFHAKGFPYGQIYSLIGCVLVIVGQIAILIQQHDLTIRSIMSTYILIPILSGIWIWSYFRNRNIYTNPKN